MAIEPYAFVSEDRLCFQHLSLTLEGGTCALRLTPLDYHFEQRSPYFDEVALLVRMESPQFSVDVRTSWTLATFRERSGYVEENLGAARNRSWQAQAYRFELGLDRTESRLQRFTVSVGLESERTLSDGPEEFRFTASFKTDMTQLTLLRQGIVTLLQLIARNLPER